MAASIAQERKLALRSPSLRNTLHGRGIFRGLSSDRDRVESDYSYFRWPTRRKKLEALICSTLSFRNNVRLSAALTTYGGVLWVPYLFWLFVLVLPLVTAEITLGHFVNLDIEPCWEMCLIAKGNFYCGLYLSCLVTLTNITFFTYALQYLASYLSKVAFGPQFRAIHSSDDYVENVTSVDYEVISTVKKQKESEDYSVFIYVNIYCLIILLITRKGIRSVSGFSTVLLVIAHFLLVVFLLLAIHIRGGNSEMKKWDFDWNVLSDYIPWLLCLEHVVSGCTLGTLNLIFVAVHSDFTDDAMVDVLIVLLSNFLNTFLFSFTVFLIKDRTFKVDEKYHYASLPVYLAVVSWVGEGFSKLPTASGLWFILFYVYMFSMITAQVIYCVAMLIDVFIAKYPRMRFHVLYLACSICACFLLVSCIITFGEIKDFYIPQFNTTFLVNAFFESMILFWVYGYETFATDFHFLMGYKVSLYYRIFWMVSPMVLLIMILVKVSLTMPPNLNGNNSLILFLCQLGFFILYGIIQTYFQKKKGESLNVFHRNPTFGPANTDMQKSRAIFSSKNITKEHTYRQELHTKPFRKPQNITDQCIVELDINPESYS